MIAFRRPNAGPTLLLTLLLVCALSGCQTPSAPGSTGTGPGPEGQKPTETGKLPPPPPALPSPPPPTPIDEGRAEKLSRQAVDALDNGKVDAARALIEEALQAAPNYELAAKLRRQVDGDLPPGPTWRYNLCPEDTLSKVAERFLKDRFLFWYIARINNIAVPKDIKLGQSVMIPGIAPSSDRTSCPGRTVPAPAPPPPVAAPSPPVPSAQAQATQEVAAGDQCARRSDTDCAFHHYDAALRLVPDNGEIRAKQVGARKMLVAAIMKAGEAARVNQELNCALRQFERALALDPDNRRAADQRLRVSDLIAKYKRNFPDRSLPDRCSQPAPGE